MEEEIEEGTLVDLPPGTPHPCHLTLDPDEDLLCVVEYGAVWDGAPYGHVLALEEDGRLTFLLREPTGPVIAFAVDEPWEFDPLSLDVTELWEGPRFTVPVLGLRDASVGEVLLATRGRFAKGEPTTDAIHFHAAIAAKEQDDDLVAAEGNWRMCLEAGDMKAHFGLGYTLVDQGRAREGYDHLRIYTELTPRNAWSWCWLGRAAEAVGDPEEAAIHYERAVSLEAGGSFETDAPELLAALRGDG